MTQKGNPKSPPRPGKAGFPTRHLSSHQVQEKVVQVPVPQSDQVPGLGSTDWGFGFRFEGLESRFYSIEKCIYIMAA